MSGDDKNKDEKLNISNLDKEKKVTYDFGNDDDEFDKLSDAKYENENFDKINDFKEKETPKEAQDLDDIVDEINQEQNITQPTTDVEYNQPQKSKYSRLKKGVLIVTLLATLPFIYDSCQQRKINKANTGLMINAYDILNQKNDRIIYLQDDNKKQNDKIDDLTEKYNKAKYKKPIIIKTTKVIKEPRVYLGKTVQDDYNKYK